MKLIFKLPLLTLSIAAALNANAEDLSTILIEDTVSINPNTSTPEEYNRTKATSADGGDFLKQVNGVSISRFGGRGLEPVIRGQSQTRLNILLDGAYVHGGCPNRMDPPTSWAALETYENVVVQKGVQTLVNGSGGSGGTVLFERDTRELAEEKGVHGRLSLMGSDNGIQHDGLADVVAAGVKSYVRGIAEIKKNENYEDGDGTEVRSAFDHTQGGLILGYTPTEDRLLELSVEQNRFRDVLYTGKMDSPKEDGDIMRLRYEDKPLSSKVDSIKAEVYLSDIEHLMDNYSLRTIMNPDMRRATPTTSETLGGRVVLNSTLNQNTRVEYGIDVQNNDRDAELINMATGATVSLMWPGLFAGVIADVAFVDMLNTILDDTLPLTPGEWSQWGNPIESEQAYRWIASYSPYDNVEAKDYPAMLVTAGVSDPRVTYWEPAKWVAKLRELKTDDNVLMLKTNMTSGHFGATGRFAALEDTAESYAFALKAVGKV